MENEALLEKYGLFSAKVPRYTSYPPANRFKPEIGRRVQPDWLSALNAADPVSIYVHIPFCRRLCWFCACRTQGTQTLRPVEAYVDVLIEEIAALTKRMPGAIPMARLHLGGGTPTLLSPGLMERLLASLFDAFPTAPGFEFSVEIDPTEADETLLATLASWGMRRASVGVQDFALVVQDAIGREQSFEQTRRVVDTLREHGVKSLNLDLLYGLPFQTDQSLARTLAQVLNLAPDRLALYGYAHVPHVSKRQVMIKDDALPDTLTRYRLAEMSRKRLIAQDYTPIGIDHFARPTDSLATALDSGSLKRNFQGYTDDPCETLIGIGASAISQFRDGFSQNAVATAAYTENVTQRGLAGHRGFVMSETDHLIASMIQDLMCQGKVELSGISQRAPHMAHSAQRIVAGLCDAFPDAVAFNHEKLSILPQARSLARIIATAVNEYAGEEAQGSLAI